MPDLLIEDIPEDLLSALTEIAEKHGRSLEDEVRVLLNEYAALLNYDPAEAEERIRKLLDEWRDRGGTTEPPREEDGQGSA